MKRRLLKIGAFAAAIALGLVVLAYSAFELSKSRSFQFFGGLTNRVETDEKVVALTFDDAPTVHTTEVLNILRDRGIRATFYEIGQNIEKNPDIARTIIAEGMEVGNHSYSHQRFLLKSQSFIEQEVERTNQLIRDSGYAGEITFRPPNGKKLLGLPWYLSKHNIKTITWDVEPDTYYSGKDDIIKNVLEETRPGSIILMHPFCDACSGDREALPVIIDELKARGFEFLTVSELLQKQK